MEMEKEGHNQPKMSPRHLISNTEVMENGEEDRISALPDYLLLEILSRLPSTKYAIRTGALSKRWNHLWTLVPSLIFQYHDHNLPWSDFVSSVDNTLTQCPQLKLKKFQFSKYYTCNIQSGPQVKKWIYYAISRHVEELNLPLWSLTDECSLHQSFFINTCFTNLTLEGFISNPVGAISWRNLRSLCIKRGNLDEGLIENILSGSPVLETFVLNECQGHRRLDITSKSVKNLVLNNYCPKDIVEIKAPNISSLTINGIMRLRKILLVNISSLVEANLDYRTVWYGDTRRKEPEEVMLEGFILNLRHVKELTIGVKCLEVVSRLKEKGLVFSSNIKFLDEFYRRVELGDV